MRETAPDNKVLNLIGIEVQRLLRGQLRFKNYLTLHRG